MISATGHCEQQFNCMFVLFEKLFLQSNENGSICLIRSRIYVNQRQKILIHSFDSGQKCYLGTFFSMLVLELFVTSADYVIFDFSSRKCVVILCKMVPIEKVLENLKRIKNSPHFEFSEWCSFYEWRIQMNFFWSMQHATSITCNDIHFNPMKRHFQCQWLLHSSIPLHKEKDQWWFFYYYHYEGNSKQHT